MFSGKRIREPTRADGFSGLRFDIFLPRDDPDRDTLLEIRNCDFVFQQI
jgi:hypothetical protein